MTRPPQDDSDRRDRDRYRRWWIGAVMLSGLLAVTLAAGAGLYGYDTGRVLAQREVSRLDDQARVLHHAIAELRQSNQRMTAALEVLELRELEWKLRFEADPHPSWARSSSSRQSMDCITTTSGAPHEFSGPTVVSRSTIAHGAADYGKRRHRAVDAAIDPIS